MNSSEARPAPGEHEPLTYDKKRAFAEVTFPEGFVGTAPLVAYTDVGADDTPE
jgi:hypothetical protein